MIFLLLGPARPSGSDVSSEVQERREEDRGCLSRSRSWVADVDAEVEEVVEGGVEIMLLLLLRWRELDGRGVDGARD